MAMMVESPRQQSRHCRMQEKDLVYPLGMKPRVIGWILGTIKLEFRQLNSISCEAGRLGRPLGCALKICGNPREVRATKLNNAASRDKQKIRSP
jgi:hypothetical protein